MVLVVFSLFVLFICSCFGCTTDLDCGGANQAGLCQSGVCQCGVGFSGNQLIDPSSCSLTCTPEAVPDAVAFLIEPNVTVSASAGNLVLDIAMDPYLKQIPTTVAFLNPQNGSACGLMPQALGTGEWSQAIEDSVGQCFSRYVFSSPFAATVGQPCWQTLPSTTETGSQFSIDFNQYSTQVEVIQQGMAPFGQAAVKRNKKDEVPISREFRRDYVISVATSFTPTSAPFTVIANGALSYRLVKINYNILGGFIQVTVQTRTPATAKVGNVQVSLGASVGISAVTGGPTTGVACDASSPAGACDQFHVINFDDSPCKVNGANLVLSVTFLCADGSAANTCGFVNLPTDSVYSLPNLILTYDACARVVEYGVNTANSYLRLNTDVARSVALATPVTQGSTYYGRCSIEPTVGAQFQSVTLSSLNVVEQDISGPINLGNQLAASFLTMVSGLTSTSASNPVFDFNLLIAPAFFSLNKVYYLEATLDLTFANTGPLTKKLLIPLTQFARGVKAEESLKSQFSGGKSVELIAVNARATPAPNVKNGVASDPFTTQPKAAEVGASSASNASSQGGGNGVAVVAAGIAVGIAVIVAAIIVVVVVRRRKANRERANSDSPLTSIGINVPSSNVMYV